MPTGPNDKIENWLDLSQYTSQSLLANGVSSAWTAFKNTNGVYPNTSFVFGNYLYFGAY